MKRLLCIVLMSCMLCAVCGCTDDPDYEDRSGWTVQFVTEIGSPTERDDETKEAGSRFRCAAGGDDGCLSVADGEHRH